MRMVTKEQLLILKKELHEYIDLMEPEDQEYKIKNIAEDIEYCMRKIQEEIYNFLIDEEYGT